MKKKNWRHALEVSLAVVMILGAASCAKRGEFYKRYKNLEKSDAILVGFAWPFSIYEASVAACFPEPALTQTGAGAGKCAGCFVVSA